jgi:hypothetical protein
VDGLDSTVGDVDVVGDIDGLLGSPRPSFGSVAAKPSNSLLLVSLPL